MKYIIDLILEFIVSDIKKIGIRQEILIKEIYLLKKTIDHMAENTQQALDKLDLIAAKIQKIGTESSTMLQKIKELQDAANANADTPPEVLAKIDEVAAQAQVVDDLVPDVEQPPIQPPVEG